MKCPPLIQNLGLLIFSLLVCAAGLIWSATFTDSVVAGEERATEAAVRVIPVLSAKLNARGLQFGFPVFIRVFKEEGELEVWIQEPNKQAFKRFKTYKIANWGEGGLGPKLLEGDGQAPEGFYVVGKRQLNPRSSFHLAFDLGFPNAYDRVHNRTGSALMIHGSESSIGCYAMSDPIIEEIYTLVAAALNNGQPYVSVHAFPFRMSLPRMLAAGRERSQWLPFWKNLKLGYDWFESRNYPPRIIIKDLQYQFSEP